MSLTFPSIEVGHTIGGRYKLVREIGRGPRGLVFEARDLDFEEWPVALKVLPAEFVAKRGLLERLKDSAQEVFQLMHENIVRLHEVECIDGIGFIVMQLLKPVTGKTKATSDHKLPFSQVCHIAQSAVSGLAAAHNLGVFHGALKPSNLMWSNEHVLKLVDVGTLCKVSETKNQFTAPERLRGEAPSALSDQYSLAATLEALLSDEAPQCAIEAINRAKSLEATERFDDCNCFLEAFVGDYECKAEDLENDEIVEEGAAHEDTIYFGDEVNVPESSSSWFGYKTLGACFVMMLLFYSFI